MMFEEVFRSLPVEGWLTREEAELLWDYATVMSGDILEIGTYCGRSARLLANAIIKNPSRILYCCDPIIEGFDGVETSSRQEIVLSILNNVMTGPAARQVCFHWMTERRLFDIWDERNDLSIVYIDGDHSKEATLGAIQRWCPLAKRIIFHDYGGSHPGVAEAINEYGLKSRLAVHGRIAVFEGGLA